MKISIAPIQYFWEKQKVFDFYNELKDSPADIVYLGETVCAKRREISLSDWLEIAEQLTAAGKEVVLSSLTLFEAESELASLRHVVANGHYVVEANDMAATQLLSGCNSFVIGPHINCYNRQTLEYLRGLGATRWVSPYELGAKTIHQLQQSSPANMEVEVLAFGHLSLAFSARCYTARSHNIGKDDCGFICRDYADGLPMYTQGNKPFLIFNGIQTQSATTQNLVAQLPELADLGVDIARVMPQSQGTIEIVDIFHKVINGKLQAEAALAELQPHLLYESCNGYWYGQAGMAYVDRADL